MNRTVKKYTILLLLLVYLASIYRYTLWQIVHLTSHQLEHVISHQLSHDSDHNTSFFHTHPHDLTGADHHHFTLELLINAWNILDYIPDEQMIHSGKFSQVSLHIIPQSYIEVVHKGISGQISGLYQFAVIEFMALIPDPPPWVNN